MSKNFLFVCLSLCILFFAASAAQAATFTVTTVADSGAGSLRQAITNANATVSVTTNIINFNIAGGVVRTVNLLSALPDSTRDLTIDGTTMAGYSGTPLFELNGTSANGLTIFDDDGGLPPNVSVGGQIVENALPLANVLVTLNGSQTATALTDASGNYSFANLPAGGNFLVAPTLSGHSFEPQSLSYTNLAANIANANFVGSTGPPARNSHIVSGNTNAGQNVTVAVELSSQNNENSVGFSLGYDASLVFNPQVTLGADAGAASLIVNNSQAGRLGIVLALPAAAVFRECS